VFPDLGNIPRFRGFHGNLGIRERFYKMAISRDFYGGIRQYVGESVLAALSDRCGEIEFPTLGYFVKSLLS